MPSLVDRLLDKSIYFSFDQSGFRRHAARFDPAALDGAMDGKCCLVTGANSGLGFEIAKGLAARAASVHMLCRNRDRGERAANQIRKTTGNSAVFLHIIDLADLASARHFARRLALRRVDVLVHNAGLLPLERELSPQGLELTVATHLVGPFLLTQLLQPKLADARIVFVSSGGMYAKRLDVDTMLALQGPYDGVTAYAMTKRAQVVLTQQLAVQLAPQGTSVHCMHPGWADTPGVERSLPRFYKWTRSRLRTPEQGADTAVWLAIADLPPEPSGRFWFDRQVVSPYLLPGTRESAHERDRLWQFLLDQIAPYMES